MEKEQEYQKWLKCFKAWLEEVPGINMEDLTRPFPRRYYDLNLTPFQAIDHILIASGKEEYQS